MTPHVLNHYHNCVTCGIGWWHCQITPCYLRELARCRKCVLDGKPATPRVIYGTPQEGSSLPAGSN